MDLYISSMLLGVLGLAAMALSGLGSHGHASHGGHGHGHAGHVGHTHGHLLAHGVRGHRGGGRDNQSGSFFWAIMSPRFLFSFALGFGAGGEVVRPFLSGPLQFGAAVAGGVLLERLIVTPLWNFAMKFASAPAITLESAIDDEATAVTAFDADGHGIVSLELDGQVVQVLATLVAGERSTGVRVRAGQRVRIQDVNPATNQCTVSLL